MRLAVLAIALFAASASADDLPAATLSSVDGSVDVGGAGATKGSVIGAGNGVVTASNAHAELKLRDGARVRLSASTSFYVLGKPAAKGSKKLALAESTLVKGAVWAIASSATMAPIVTPAGRVVLGSAAEAKLHVEGGVTRISVHKGKVTVAGVEIGEGFGVKGKAKSKLPDPPKWTAAPKVSTVTFDETAAVSGMASGHASKWHLVVSMDAEMNDILVDSIILADGPTLMVEQKLPIGSYFMRVAAISADGLESGWSAVAPSTVSKKPKAP